MRKRNSIDVWTDEMRELLISELKKGTVVESLFPLFNMKFKLSMQTAGPIRTYINKNVESLSEAVGFNVANLGRRNPIDKSGFVPELSQPMAWREGRLPGNSVLFSLVSDIEEKEKDKKCRRVVGENGAGLYVCGNSLSPGGVGSCCRECAKKMYLLSKKHSQPKEGDGEEATTKVQKTQLLPPNARGKFTSHLVYPSRG